MLNLLDGNQWKENQLNWKNVFFASKKLQMQVVSPKWNFRKKHFPPYSTSIGDVLFFEDMKFKIHKDLVTTQFGQFIM